MQLHNFAEVDAELAKYIPAVREITGKDITLARMKPLMNLLGNPQDKLRVIHVAGTSGKTSTAHFIAAMLMNSGKRVGLTVSPHIADVNERVQINLNPLEETEFCQQLSSFFVLIKNADVQPTYFELLTAFAYWYFKKAKVDYAVIETGLGGLHDATNIAARPNKLCVITDIGFDHTHILGNTLPAISYQKAGIIYPHNQVYMYKQPREVTDVFVQQAQLMRADLHLLVEKELNTRYETELPKLPLYQQRNWLLAREVYDAIAKMDNLTHSASLQFAKNLQIVGRMDVKHIGDKTVVLDGAHNGQKMTAFVESFKHDFPGRRAAILLALKVGKDYKAVLPQIKPICEALIVTSYKLKQDLPIQAMDPHELAKEAWTQGFRDVEVIEDYKIAYQKLLAAKNSLAVVTGSFYLLACLWPMLGKKERR